MTPFQFVSIVIIACYATGLIGIVRELIAERKTMKTFVRVLFDAMPKIDKVMFWVALFTIGPFMWMWQRTKDQSPSKQRH